VTSERKIRANRASARGSTGPKTAQGRSHAARNALRHALSLPVSSDPVLSEEVEELAREIAGTDANAEKQELARRIAETQIDLRRVRHVRHQLFSQTLGDPDYESEVMLRKKSALVIGYAQRFDLRAGAAIRKAGCDPPDPSGRLRCIRGLVAPNIPF
jgi:hypothetical protein